MQRQNTVFSMKCVHYISEGEEVEWYSCVTNVEAVAKLICMSLPLSGQL